MKHSVTIFQHRLLHYRVPFFDLLRVSLGNEDVDLKLVHGQASSSEWVRKDEGVLPWANKIHNSFARIGGVDICWQHFPKEVFRSNLIILMQENRIISNYYFLLRRKFFNEKIAFWGHGANFQSKSRNSLREKWKKMVLHHVDWWFAYTQATVDIIASVGYNSSQVTCLNNSLDTESFKADIQSVSLSDTRDYFCRYNIPQDAIVGLFCGSLYLDKKIDFLIEAVDKIKDVIPNFHLVVIGNGPDACIIKDAIESRSWIHYLGIKVGIEKAALFKVSKVLLNPGAVGLHIVDSFCAGLPMVTTFAANHGPEFVYLENSKNGLATGDSVDDYAHEVISLLLDENRRSAMAYAALESAHKYSLGNMVENMKNGILLCLNKESKFACMRRLSHDK